MAGNQTVKDLDRKARGRLVHLSILPGVVLQGPGKRRREQVYLEPAAATSISELKALAISAGDLQKYDCDPGR